MIFSPPSKLWHKDAQNKDLKCFINLYDLWGTSLDTREHDHFLEYSEKLHHSLRMKIWEAGSIFGKKLTHGYYFRKYFGKNSFFMTKDILEQMTHKSIKNVPAYLNMHGFWKLTWRTPCAQTNTWHSCHV